ncbi:MAG: UDP-2,3-diacylglucosamine diphosphatase [Saprospiraceae bacterium]|nr:UDP-2,3-diacylglucosamine diphosphatase [Saprospiraceae bacterium]
MPLFMKKVYFVSDFHLGVDARLTSLDRERLIVRWLDFVAPNAEAIYLVGDVFDYWFEYNKAIPKGFSRLLGKLSELRDDGLPIYFFTGNHDMWMFRYLSEEMGIPIYREPIIREIYGKTFYIGHGDGLGPDDHGYKFIKKVFANPICQWLFARLHPNLGLGLMQYFSSKSREGQDPSVENTFLGEDKEWLIQYANEKIQTDLPHIDYFIFGHRHLTIDWILKNGKSRYINLGEWLHSNTFAVFDSQELVIKTYENENVKIYSNSHELQI